MPDLMSALLDIVNDDRPSDKVTRHRQDKCWSLRRTSLPLSVLRSVCTVQLSHTIRRLRFEHDEMTQKELAKRVGVSRQTICSIENGKHSPSLELAIRIADVFRESVDNVFKLDYEGKPARPEQPVRAAGDRPKTTIEKPVDVEARPEPPDTANEAEFSLADLRGVIG